MKVVKPNALSVITRCFEHQRRQHFAVSVLAFVPLTDEGDGPLLPEVSLWTTVAEQLGPSGVLEPGMPKARGEMLVHGAAFAPGGVPRRSVPVVARVGPIDKALLVHGDRYFTPSREPSEAQPFARMPIEWSRAYGGPRFPANPLGRGHGESDYMGQRVQLLPNLERPDALVVSPRDRPEPVSLGPLDISWPKRRARAGTYDKTWTETLYPGLAADIDWRLFNLADEDQQLEGFFEGGETFRFDNLHPSRPVLQGRVPTTVARAFVTRSTEGTDAGTAVEPTQRPTDETDDEAPAVDPVSIEEVPLSLRTLWFFPEIERLVMVFQGSTEITHPEGADVRHLMLAAEDREHPRPLTHYARALEDRLDPDHGHLASLRDHELLPESMAGHVDEGQAAEQALHQTERLMEHNLHRRAVAEHEAMVQRVREAGLDPEQCAPPPPQPPAPPPSLDELPALVEQLQSDADTRQADARARAERDREALRTQLLDQGMPAEEADALLSAAEKGPTGPPKFTADGQRAQIVELLQQVPEGIDAEQLRAALVDDEQYERWKAAEKQLHDTYRATAHLQDPAPALSAERSEQARLAVREALEKGVDFGTLDLTGADLSGMSLRGAKMAGAYLESTTLDGADLRGADLRHAVLAHASLVDVRLDEAYLQHANLGGADLRGACLREADLDNAVLMSARLPGAVLHGARLRGADLFRVVLTDADASEIVTERAVFLEAEVTGLNLTGARLDEAAFLELDLRGCQFLGAHLSRATFVSCEAPGVTFAGATLDNARFVQDCDLTEASLAGASLRSTNLRGVLLTEAVLDQVTAEGADLSGANLRRARLYRASARGARFDEADLEDATLVAANLMQASLLGATIRGVDLRGANLYGADMARVRTDDRVRLEQANLTKVRVLPRHQEPPGSP